MKIEYIARLYVISGPLGSVGPGIVLYSCGSPTLSHNTLHHKKYAQAFCALSGSFIISSQGSQVIYFPIFARFEVTLKDIDNQPQQSVERVHTCTFRDAQFAKKISVRSSNGYLWAVTWWNLFWYNHWHKTFAGNNNILMMSFCYMCIWNQCNIINVRKYRQGILSNQNKQLSQLKSYIQHNYVCNCDYMQ